MAKDIKDEIYARQIIGHTPHVARNVGTGDPGDGKQETPTTGLPNVEGNQQTERVKVGGVDVAEPTEKGDTEE